MMKIMKKSPRHEVISLRLNEDRLKLLERSRDLLTNQLGRPVSLAEAAFLVLEDRAVGMDRNASRFEMLETPTASLDRIRRQWESQHTLSAAEWDVVAYYVQIGSEEERQVPPRLWPAIPSRESSLALLDAFEAVYQKRKAPASPHVWSYFGNLDGYGSVTLSDTDAGQRHQALLDQIAKQRHALRTNDPWSAPHLGRCFSLAIRDEGVDSIELDHTLAVYWPTLWGLAARGHWIRHREPVRAAGTPTLDPQSHFNIPSPMTVGDFTISFAPYGGPEFATSISFRGARTLSVSIMQYPELVEFHAMLDGMGDRPWLGKYFRAFMSDDQPPGTRLLCIKRFEVGVDLSEREWDDLRTLVRQAWQHRELQPWLAELQKEYGEQGERRDGEAR
jgi:hypothetical protein